MREGKHKNVLFLNEPLFCFIEPGAEGAQRKELAFLNERVNGLTGGTACGSLSWASPPKPLHCIPPFPITPNWLHHRGENNRKSERNIEGVRRRHQGRENANNSEAHQNGGVTTATHPHLNSGAGGQNLVPHEGAGEQNSPKSFQYFRNNSGCSWSCGAIVLQAALRTRRNCC